jgi:preprotein translocase subunit SecD
MIKNLRWKVITILTVFLVFTAVGIYPILAALWHLPAPGWLMAKQLRLGLDLKGGVHLVMRVQTDDALRIYTTTAAEQLREALTTAGVAASAINVTAPQSFRVEGVPPDRDAEFRRIADEQTATIYERASGVNGSYDFRMRQNIERNMRDEAVVQMRQTLDRRVNELGVTEPTISVYGQSGDQILVQLPGVTDVARAKEIMGKTALLELKLVEEGPAATREALLQSHNGQVPSDMEVVSGAPSAAGDTTTVYYLVKKTAAVTGQDLRSAKPSLDENNRQAVSFSLKPDGARKFAKVTGENIGRSLAIVLDSRVQSAPRIDGRIESEGRISGSFTSQEVADLALTLRSGALPAGLTYLEERVIGPTLGLDAIKAGATASAVGLVLVVIFMLFYYRLAGVNAVVALLFNLVILLGLMAYFGAVMTLPGIAGFVLTMGIGVDSNVLIFERIKEELAAERGVRASINAGFGRVFLTLLDTHIAALISAMFLFQFGTGPIRGFATTLSLGLMTNLFTSIFVSKTLFELELSRRRTAAATLSI